MSHAPQTGGQAPDQANSGRQTGAAARPDRSFPRHAQSGQSPDESQAARLPASLTVPRGGRLGSKRRLAMVMISKSGSVNQRANCCLRLWRR